MNRMEINAALWDLVHEKDIPQAADTVIKYCSALPEQKKLSGSFRVSLPDKPKGGFVGHTEHGDMQTEDGDQKREWKKEFGAPYERLGHFKMWRNGSEIGFCHFWAADLETNPDPELENEKFLLIYDPNTLKLLTFGVWVRVPLFTLGPLHIFKDVVKTIHGEPSNRILRGGYFKTY